MAVLIDRKEERLDGDVTLPEVFNIWNEFDPLMYKQPQLRQAYMRPELGEEDEELAAIVMNGSDEGIEQRRNRPVPLARSNAMANLNRGPGGSMMPTMAKDSFMVRRRSSNMGSGGLIASAANSARGDDEDALSDVISPVPSQHEHMK
jgi:hypothetical protein